METERSTTNLASYLGNDPMFSQYMGREGPVDLGAIPDTAAIGDPYGDFRNTPHSPRNFLMALRAQFPYLPIMPFSKRSICVGLDGINPQDVNVPSGAVIALLNGSGDYFMGRDAKARAPGANAQIEDSAYRPDNRAFYCEGVRQISLFAPTAGTYVSVEFYFVAEIPE
jgi:hypothetical protein